MFANSSYPSILSEKDLLLCCDYSKQNRQKLRVRRTRTACSGQKNPAIQSLVRRKTHAPVHFYSMVLFLLSCTPTPPYHATQQPDVRSLRDKPRNRDCIAHQALTRACPAQKAAHDRLRFLDYQHDEQSISRRRTSHHTSLNTCMRLFHSFDPDQPRPFSRFSTHVPVHGPPTAPTARVPGRATTTAGRRSLQATERLTDKNAV